jgi:hypothetical protein
MTKRKKNDKHYTENKRSNNTNPTKIRGWSQVLLTVIQFAHKISDQWLCFTHSPPHIKIMYSDRSCSCLLLQLSVYSPWSLLFHILSLIVIWLNVACFRYDIAEKCQCDVKQQPLTLLMHSNLYPDM